MADSSKKIRVLIVDDSAVMRSLLNRVLSKDSEIEVVGLAPDPFVARDKIAQLEPDVITLDIEMPKMDGLTFLSHVMKARPIRTLVLSSLSTSNSETALKALELGAIDVMAKPAIDVTKGIEELAQEICMRVKAVAQARIPATLRSFGATNSLVDKSKSAVLTKTTDQVLVIASSTGGTEALRYLLPKLPADIPGTLIVQHMPPVFTASYSASLNNICSFEVKEAANGDRVMPGRALLCPGDYHMDLNRNGAYYHVKLHQEPKLHGVRPAADYTMKSAARVAGKNCIGLVLTGMGKDGALGLLEMKNAGSYNIAQDEASCIVFGMPKEAIGVGAIHKILPLDQIAEELNKQFKQRDVALNQART